MAVKDTHIKDRWKPTTLQHAAKSKKEKAPKSFENIVRLLVGEDTECGKHCNFMSYAKETTGKQQQWQQQRQFSIQMLFKRPIFLVNDLTLNSQRF